MENESLYLLRGKQLVWARLAWIVVVLPLFGIVQETMEPQQVNVWLRDKLKSGG